MEIHIISLLLGALIIGLMAFLSFLFTIRIIRGKAEQTLTKYRSQDLLKYSILEEKYVESKNKQCKLVEKNQKFSSLCSDLREKLSKKELDFHIVNERNEFQQKEMKRIQQEFSQGFQLLSNKIIKNNSIEFAKFNKDKMGEILTPLQDKIHSFESQINRIHKEDIEARAGLSVELKRLIVLNQQLSEDATNLSNSLRQDSKQQGNWGEFVLERILEKSGLIKGQEYQVQATFKSENGNNNRPDITILLPDNKHLIVDSKVSMTAYDRFVNEENDRLKEVYLKKHLLSVKAHIKELGAKEYSTLTGVNSPDFVLLFIPLESAFALAVREDVEIFQYAWEKNIVIVSPSTLLASLRTVASIWKHEKQTQNAYQIANEAGKMYDKFVNFINEYEKIGQMIGKLQESYDNSYKKLTSGKGNIISKIENLQKMGISNKKEISKSLSKVSQPL